VFHLPRTREKKIRNVNWVLPELGPTKETRFVLTKPSWCCNWDLQIFQGHDDAEFSLCAYFLE